MPAYTQDTRLIGITTPLGKDVLLLRGFSGRESLSQLSAFDLDLLSKDPEIKFEDIIGKRVTLRVTLSQDKERYFNGFISRFVQTGAQTGMANYRATMVPWLWFLTKTTDCRIFQNKTIPDIVQQIFKEYGFTDVKAKLQGTYEPRDYCVQYRETDYNFVARLMEQYGIFYFFEHEKEKHTLVLTDNPDAHQPCPEQPKAKWNPQGSKSLTEDVVGTLEVEKIFRPGKYALTDYNFETPSTSLLSEIDTTITVGGNTKYEVYDYPGEYEKKAQGKTLVKLRMEEQEVKHLSVTGTSSCRAFATGYRFDFEDYSRADLNQAYVLTAVSHSATVGDTYTTGRASDGSSAYTNAFVCIPHKVPFRPPQITPKPIVQGPQTAVIVGPTGEEIYSDKYGRVKAQFHWDREGKNDENSSCWMRASQNWAGKQWGGIFVPRIGQEVIVEFLEGDPDRPIITGRIYNAEQMPPYALPANQTQSGVKSNSSKGGGGSNEWRFEDKKGSEEIYLHGQKDWNIVIENDKSQSIGHDESLTVGNNRTKKVGVDQSEDIGSNKTIHVGANHTESIDANKTLTVGGNHTETISGNETITVSTASAHTIALARALTIGAVYQVSVGAAMNETIGAAKAEEIGAAKSVNVGLSSSENIGVNKSTDAGSNISEKAGKNISMDAGTDISAKAGKNIATNAGENISETAGKDISIKAGKKILIDAGDQITIQTGSARIQMKKNGDIVIEGKKISVNASGDIVMKGQKILQN
ncbi:MAG: type VI secretion system tip protein TssI/VgrG [Nitrospira sp.]